MFSTGSMSPTVPIRAATPSRCRSRHWSPGGVAARAAIRRPQTLGERGADDRDVGALTHLGGGESAAVELLDRKGLEVPPGVTHCAATTGS